MPITSASLKPELSCACLRSEESCHAAFCRCSTGGRSAPTVCLCHRTCMRCVCKLAQTAACARLRTANSSWKESHPSLTVPPGRFRVLRTPGDHSAVRHSERQLGYEHHYLIFSLSRSLAYRFRGPYLACQVGSRLRNGNASRALSRQLEHQISKVRRKARGDYRVDQTRCPHPQGVSTVCQPFRCSLNSRVSSCAQPQ